MKQYEVVYMKKFSFKYSAENIKDAEKRAKSFQSAHPAGHVILLGIYLDENPPPAYELKTGS